MKSNRIFVTFTLVLAVMMFATVAFAQDPPSQERRGPGGPGGPGGFRGRGPGMLPPDVMNSLSADQKAQIRTIHESERTKMKDLENQSLTQAEFRKQMMELHKATQTQVESILTPDQKAKLEADRAKHHGGPQSENMPHRPAPSQSN